ncbi:uncharacterized protein LOC62_05G007139 [Vanrija pseudolonga]|uniref:Uncharacterized protein n=1 Tax=Vanrija pseudolonga TaxID=143232 RepID=A0AAF0YGU8_9TREE|nr:hypothetical protein LOC62_05G007139 [Vanrija pseudolonga]
MTENHNPYVPSPLAAARRIPATSSRPALATAGPSRQAQAPLTERREHNGQEQAASSSAATRPSTPPAQRRSALPPLPPSPPSARRAAATPLLAPKPRRLPRPSPMSKRPSPTPLVDDEVFGVRRVEFWQPTTALVADAYAQDEVAPRKRATRRDASLRTC